MSHCVSESDEYMRWACAIHCASSKYILATRWHRLLVLDLSFHLFHKKFNRIGYNNLIVNSIELNYGSWLERFERQKLFLSLRSDWDIPKVSPGLSTCREIIRINYICRWYLYDRIWYFVYFQRGICTSNDV